MAPSKDVINKLHHAMRKVQARNRFVADAYGTHLDLAESHLLIEVASDPAANGIALSKSLSMSPMAVSRLTSSLTRKGFIRSRKSGEDRRHKQAYLTAKGREELKALHQRSSESMRHFESNLSSSDYKAFLRLITRFADGYHAPAIADMPGQHSALRQIRRLTRAMRLLGSSVFGTPEVSSLEWHVLAAIDDEHSGVRAKELCAMLSVPVNTMSTLLKRLESRDLILRTIAAHDRRASPITLSNRGKELLLKIEERAGAQIAKALRRFSEGEARRFTALFEIFGGFSGSGVSAFPPSWNVRRLERGEERIEARLFLLHALAERGWEALPGEVTFGADSLSFALRSGAGLKAVCEFQHRESWILTHALAEPGLKAELLASFLDAAMAEFRSLHPAAELRIDRSFPLLRSVSKGLTV